MVSFPSVLKEVKCPVPRFLAVAHSAVRLREHFLYRHFRSKVAVFQEGEKPLPRCELCVIHIPVGRVIKHQRMTCCDKNTQMLLRISSVEIAYRCSEVTFRLTGEEEA